MSIWLVCFLLHSTLWFGLAWLWTRLAPRMHPQTRETVWYTAIVASLVTPSVHVLAPGSLPSFWQLTLPGVLFPSLEPGLLVGEHGVPLQTRGFALTWEIALLGAWLSIAGVLLARYLTRIVALRRRLAREEVDAGSQEWIMLRNLSHRAGLRRVPRLTESENLGSPIAFGIGTLAEICVPTRALHELDREEFTAMLGHEIAHHQRLDPARLGVMNILRSLFFFQPLFRVAGRDVHWAAEEQCDALAATHVQDRMAVARCLTEVASWVLPGDHGLPVVGMAGGRSHLVRRVDRLIDERGDAEARSRTWQRFCAVSIVALAPWVAPGLAPAAEVSDQDSEVVEQGLSGYPAGPSEKAGDAGEEHSGDLGESSDESGKEHSSEGRGETNEGHGAERSERNGREHG
jgi:beta-lactamase regulating signal transducer with metallopeptidase domain